MSIREDAENMRQVVNLMGYNPEDEIARLVKELRGLRQENKQLKEEVKKLKTTLGCFNGSNK